MGTLGARAGSDAPDNLSSMNASENSDDAGQSWWAGRPPGATRPTTIEVNVVLAGADEDELADRLSELLGDGAMRRWGLRDVVQAGSATRPLITVSGLEPTGIRQFLRALVGEEQWASSIESTVEAQLAGRD